MANLEFYVESTMDSSPGDIKVVVDSDETISITADIDGDDEQEIRLSTKEFNTIVNKLIKEKIIYIA